MIHIESVSLNCHRFNYPTSASSTQFVCILIAYFVSLASGAELQTNISIWDHVCQFLYAISVQGARLAHGSDQGRIVFTVNEKTNVHLLREMKRLYMHSTLLHKGYVTSGTAHVVGCTAKCPRSWTFNLRCIQRAFSDPLTRQYQPPVSSS